MPALRDWIVNNMQQLRGPGLAYFAGVSPQRFLSDAVVDGKTGLYQAISEELRERGLGRVMSDGGGTPYSHGLWLNSNNVISQVLLNKSYQNEITGGHTYRSFYPAVAPIIALPALLRRRIDNKQSR